MRESRNNVFDTRCARGGAARQLQPLEQGQEAGIVADVVQVGVVLQPFPVAEAVLERVTYRSDKADGPTAGTARRQNPG